MSKKKNKSQKNATPKLQPVAKSIALSEEDKKEIVDLSNTIQQEFESENIPAGDLNPLDESKIEDAEKKGDLKIYLKHLSDTNQRLNGLKKNYEEKKEVLETKISEAEKQNENLKKKQEEIDKKYTEINQKEKQILERELQIDKGEYTGTIRSLLSALANSEQEIANETHKIIESVKTQHLNTINQEQLLAEKEIELEKQKASIDTEKKKLRREIANFEADQEDFKEELKENLTREYNGKYEEEKTKADRLTNRNSLLEEEIEKLKRIQSEMFVAFGEKSPEEILANVDEISSQKQKLEEEISQLPSLEQMDCLRKQIDELKLDNERLNGLVSEKEILNLQTLLNNSDSYVVEIQNYKERLESSKNREDSLRVTIADLKSTVAQLKGERQKDEDAFQFARRFDSNEFFQNEGFKKHVPTSLFEFAQYMQSKIASTDKPFYYDMDTIRVFISGLNMSPITILQGISGTGKTSLPREFAKSIIADAVGYQSLGEDNTPNAPYRICAIQSGWRDNMDLMGYYNSFEHKYKETEFFKALYVANLPKYRNTLFFIILDEMNLSRPEHYFADFLSLLEQKEDERYITVNAPDEVLPKEIVHGKLRVPDNVRFIGTANHDETTLEFAPKTYDRSNLMEMPKNQERNIPTTNNSFNIGYDWLKQQFSKSIKDFQDEYLEFKKFINSDDVKLLLMGKGIGIGNRFEDQAAKFISTFIATGNPNEVEESLAKAADHLITTRLFRTLKNRYDLDKHSLQSFKEEYDKLFNAKFGSLPVKADEMLNAEIEKK